MADIADSNAVMSTRICTQMAILNNVNDDEIRHGLLHYGFPNIPVTETTRPLLLKKLYAQITSESKNSSYTELLCKRLKSNFKRNNYTGESLHQISVLKWKKRMNEPILSYKTKEKYIYEHFQHLRCENQLQKNLCPKIFNQLLASESEEDYDSFKFSAKPNLPDQSSQRACTPSFKHVHRNPSLFTTCHQLVNKIFGQCYRNEMYKYCNKNRPPSVLSSKVHTISEIIYSLKLTMVSSLLMVMLFLSITLITIAYIFTTADMSGSINWDNTEFVICSTNDAQVQSSLSCIERKHIEVAITTTQLLLTLLHKRVVAHFCFDSSASIYVSTKEFLSQLNQLKPDSNILQSMMDLHNVEYLISKNLNWGIRHVNAIGSELFFEDVIKKRENPDNYFSLKKSLQPLRCTLKSKLQSFFIVVGSAFLLGIFILILRLCYNRMIRRKMKTLLISEKFKNQIIKELLYTSSRNGSTFESREVNVKDLQDKILPNKYCSEMLSAWNHTVNELEMNDNRIQFGISIENGNKIKTIKFISNNNKIFLNPNLLKFWHSPAFNKTNKILDPPTSCLKIRQMFDSSEIDNPHLKQVIVDAILEKVGRGCKIFEIQFDTDSCCVYVRCATEKDAGIVHDEINGWWFDKRLVSIKFLRLQRFLARFPKSSGEPICLLPSNSNNLSMSQFI